MKYKLDDIDKKTGFEVPEGYFEDLSLKIQKRIEKEKVEERTFTLPSWSMAMAASMLVILAFVFIVYEQQETPEDLLAAVDQEDLIAYVSQLEMDEYDLASAFPDETESIEFEDINMFDIDMEDESLDEILDEYNLDDELLEI